jgi:enoyl-CoA hydratase/carnithine racemase
MTVTEKPGIQVSIDGYVALVTMIRPPHNTVSLEVARDLADTFEELDGVNDVRSIVLAAEGKSFCAGADLSNAFQDVEESVASTKRFYDEVVRLHTNQKPVVAAVQGPAIGAGVGMTLIADFRIASPEARFATNFVKLGFHPGYGLTHTLPALVGAQNARMMLLTGRRLKAEEALAIGLVDHVVEQSHLRAAAIALAAEIAENAPLAVQSTRATLRAGLASSVRRQLDHEFSRQTELMKTADFAEGVASVRERRPGKFVGR